MVPLIRASHGAGVRRKGLRTDPRTRAGKYNMLHLYNIVYLLRIIFNGRSRYDMLFLIYQSSIGSRVESKGSSDLPFDKAGAHD